MQLLRRNIVGDDEFGLHCNKDAGDIVTARCRSNHQMHHAVR